MMALMLSMGGQMEGSMGIDPNEGRINKIPEPIKPPTGTKEYWFNSSGEFSCVRMLKVETVYSCYAINEKNAIKKYRRWLQSKEQK